MPECVLQTHGLTKRFGALKATDNVSFDVRPGEIHALIGPNGAGKSTLIAQIAGAITPDQGEVILHGHDVTRLPTFERARLGLARTFQISSLAMEDTVFQNALLGALGASGKRLGVWRAAARRQEASVASAALERVGLGQMHSMRVAELSHGQRRQLEVAVALTLQPKILVMDEPLAGLGAEGSAAMTELLGDLRESIPILLVEHDMDAVFALADRITVLVYGRVIATGTVDEVRQNPEVRQAYLGDEE